MKIAAFIHLLGLAAVQSLISVAPTKVRVSNIDWFLSTADVESKIRKVFADDSIIKVEVKPPRRNKRDEGKLHSGSAIVVFSDKRAVARALTSTATSSINQWRISEVMEKEEEPTKKEVSPERVLLRQERAGRYARQRARRASSIDNLLDAIGEAPIEIESMSVEGIDFGCAPPGVDPASTGGGLKLGSKRATRKRASVEAFRTAIRQLFPTTLLSELKVADLGSGTGNLAIPLAWATGCAEMLAVDIYADSLARLLARAQEAGLEEKISVECSDILDVNLAGVGMVVSLHACGAASDLAMEAAVKEGISFAISPCCIGKVNFERSMQESGEVSGGNKDRAGKPASLSYPRSRWLSDKIDIEDYTLLAKAADAADGAGDADSDWFRRGRRAKGIVEVDRLMFARERGYGAVRLLEMPGMDGYGKQELLVGSLR
ncbi:hypothetical protein TrVE_jg11903 [Triparma verrucosa]|uniref:Methyltransferase domain-containing protein n=1 Tax=Triparma verrucosa TaxID=1606542 RepID=A0A9W7B9Q7_9STRA|nr:hypothetical protein TrVE_jg11903 [Triparma verrucosa]